MPVPKVTQILQKQTPITRRRSITKAVTWRIVGSLDTFLLGYVITGELRYGALIAGTEVLTKMVLYYFHERAWAHVKWGFVIGESVSQ
jgi:uncharacterized membrane protein